LRLAYFRVPGRGEGLRNDRGRGTNRRRPVDILLYVNVKYYNMCVEQYTRVLYVQRQVYIILYADMIGPTAVKDPGFPVLSEQTNRIQNDILSLLLFFVFHLHYIFWFIAPAHRNRSPSYSRIVTAVRTRT